MAKAGRIRWTAEEWMIVMVHAVPLIDAGEHKVDALRKAQRLGLPKSRHRDADSLSKAVTPSSGTFDATRAAYRKLTPNQRDAVRAQSATPDATPEPAELAPAENGRVHWTSRECAIMAAAVERLKLDPASKGQPLSRLYLTAQITALPHARQRSKSGIYSAASTGHLAQQHAIGLEHAWQYPEAQQQAAAAPAAAIAPTPAPAPAEAAVAPASTPSSPEMGVALVTFANTLMGALGELLAVRDAQHAAQVTQLLEAHASAQHERVGQTVQDLLKLQIDVITQRMGDSLRGVLLEELGGAPKAAAEPAMNGHTNGHANGHDHAAVGSSLAVPQAVRRLRVDVIGSIDAEWAQRLADAVGEGDELRIIPPAQAGDFAPHTGRTLIWMQDGKLPRVLQKKLETVKVKPMLVRNQAGHVLRAIQDLQKTATLQ